MIIDIQRKYKKTHIKYSNTHTKRERKKTSKMSHSWYNKTSPRNGLKKGLCINRASVIISTLAICLVASAKGLQSDLRLVDNGYEGLIVSITDQIPQEHCIHIIHGLKVKSNGEMVEIFTIRILSLLRL